MPSSVVCAVTPPTRSPPAFVTSHVNVPTAPSVILLRLSPAFGGVSRSV